MADVAYSHKQTIDFHEGTVIHTRSTLRDVVVLVGRILYSAIFILASFNHFTAAGIQMASDHGVIWANALVPLSGILALLGGLSILTGYHARVGAWMIVLFLIPVTLSMHNFWTLTDPAAIQLQQGMFMKNMSMLGGALLITHFGSGPLSLRR